MTMAGCLKESELETENLFIDSSIKLTAADFISGVSAKSTLLVVR
jgi:hypothetical protein